MVVFAVEERPLERLRAATSRYEMRSTESRSLKALSNTPGIGGNE